MYTGPSRAADSRPYEKTGGVSVGAAFMAARNTANMKKLKIRRDFEK